MRRALVTGAGGFIGQRLCAALKASEIEVTALGRQVQREGPWDKWISTDLEQAQRISLSGIDTVFHLASKNHDLSTQERNDAHHQRINVKGTLAVLRGMRESGCNRLIYFSTTKVFGESTPREGVDETVTPAPTDAYGRAKWAAELLVLDHGKHHPVFVSILRLPMVYGSATKGNLPRLIRAVASGRCPPFPRRVNRRSMVHVDDVVRASMMVAQSTDANGEVFIVSDGRDYCARELYELICKGLHKSIPRWSVPYPLLRLLAWGGDACQLVSKGRAPIDSRGLEKLFGHARYSSAKIESRLGFKPRVSLADAMPVLVEAAMSAKTPQP